MFRDDRIFDEIRFVDFYRYCDLGMDELYDYLERTVPWVRPEDTGRSTNCLINDAGIFVHKRERGFHNYALPYSWDVRLGHKTREEALEELDDAIDEPRVREILAEVGYSERSRGLAKSLVAFCVVAEGAGDAEDSGIAEAAGLDEGEVLQYLGQHLPPPLVPSRLHVVHELPLTANGKLDEVALWAKLGNDGLASSVERSHREVSPPEGPVEEFLAELWQEELAVESVGRGSSFFELGGTSLTAMRVMLRLCEEFDIDVPLEAIFTHSTLSALSTVAEDAILADAETLS